MPTTNSWNSNIPIEVTKGGTNDASMSTATGIVKYDGTGLVTSATAKIDSNNILINSSQPRFRAYTSAVVNNVTGDNTAYNIICDTEDYDIGSNYDTGTGIFTVSVSGVYLFVAQAFLDGNPTSTTMYLRLVATPRTEENEYQRASGTQNYNPQIWSVMYLQAGETVYLQAQVNGASKQSDLRGYYSASTFFSGCLLY